MILKSGSEPWFIFPSNTGGLNTAKTIFLETFSNFSRWDYSPRLTSLSYKEDTLVSIIDHSNLYCGIILVRDTFSFFFKEDSQANYAIQQISSI